MLKLKPKDLRIGDIIRGYDLLPKESCCRPAFARVMEKAIVYDKEDNHPTEAALVKAAIYDDLLSEDFRIVPIELDDDNLYEVVWRDIDE